MQFLMMLVASDSVVYDDGTVRWQQSLTDRTPATTLFIFEFFITVSALIKTTIIIFVSSEIEVNMATRAL